MRINILTLMMGLLPLAALASEEHGTQDFHEFTLETDVGSAHDHIFTTWDLDGWVGNNTNKLWLKSEGEHVNDTLESAEFWAMVSRNVSTFWDAQMGVRYDIEPESTGYLVAGATGLAPYLFETEAHMFLSDEGDVTARARFEHDLLITQQLITQPYIEVNASVQDMPELGIGSGLTDGEIGLQTRYEFTKAFAPYIDVSYERLFGETSAMARDEGESSSHVIASLGLRLMW